MAERTRAYLKQEFNDGERPTGADFSDLMDSFINKEDDNVRLTNGNLTVPGGLTLANAATGQEGTLRFNSGQVEVFQGGTWNAVGGGGAFEPVAGGPHVAFEDGNVGIGTFATPPTHKLEINLNANTGPAERVRMGRLVVHRGQAVDAAFVSHQNTTADNAFALRQDSQGNTTLNAGPGAELLFTQQGTVNRMRVTTTGNMSITPQTSVTIEGNTAIGTPAVNRDLSVFGNAAKLVPGPFSGISDGRVKQDIRPLDLGLNEVCRLNPIVFKFNGKAGTPDDGKEYVGIIAQEAAEVVPFMVRRNDDLIQDQEVPDLLLMDPGPLAYIMVNAIRELTARVAELEARLAEKAQ